MKLKKSTLGLSLMHRKWALPLLIPSSMLIALPACADEGDVLRPYVGFSMVHDDNILGTNTGAGANVSDTARRIEAGLIIDKKISQQRVTADINVNRNQFNRFDNLDYTGSDVKANWNWHVGSNLEGNVGATHVRALSSVQDTVVENGLPSQTPYVRTQDRQYIDGAWRFHPSYRVRGGLSHYKLDTSQTAIQSINRSIDDAEIGFDYLAKSGSSAGVQYRHAEGDFEISPLNNYKQDEFKGRVEWKYSPKTELLFLAGWVQRDHEFNPANDFSGFNGRVNATWRATYKTTINASIWREVGALDDLVTAFSLNKGLSVGAGWEITAKARLDAYYQHENRDYNPANLARKDSINYTSLILSYYPIRKLRVQASVYRTSQSSDVAAATYDNNGGSLGLRYEF